MEIHIAYGAEVMLRNPLGADVIRVAGFPAVETQTLYAPREETCQIFLDVAAGRTIQVSYDYLGNLPMIREVACKKARTAAEFVIQTLLTRAGG